MLLRSALLLAAALSAFPALADEPAERLHPSIAADPLPYVLHGFSAHLGVQSPSNRFSFEAAVFKSALGDTLLTLIRPDDTGWKADLKGFTLEGYWHPITWGRNALLLGLQAHFDEFNVHRDDEAGSATVHQIYLMPTIGYRWFPFDAIGLFFKPFAGLGLPILGVAPVRLGAHLFEQLPVFPLATVIVGYQF